MKTQFIDVAQLKKAIDPIDFYTSEGQEITTRGCSSWKLGGLCPFHDDHHAGSFYINDIDGSYSCFSCKTFGNDIIDFTQKKYGLRFGEALHKLANEWRIL